MACPDRCYMQGIDRTERYMSRKKTEKERRKVGELKRKNRRRFPKLTWSWLVILFFIAFIVLRSVKATQRMNKLRDEGVIVSGKVIGKTSGRKNNKYVRYEFMVDGYKYTGETRSMSLYHDCRIGGLICVVYLPSNPNINDSCEKLDE